jgi:hypothetical protein
MDTSAEAEGEVRHHHSLGPARISAMVLGDRGMHRAVGSACMWQQETGMLCCILHELMGVRDIVQLGLPTLPRRMWTRQQRQRDR